jgi:phosphoglycerol geranylgeranyltransferase
VVDKFIVVSYVIQNTDSKAATVAGVSNSLAVEQVREAALAIEMFSAGTFGEPTAREAASTHLQDTILLYGGPIPHRRSSTILAAGANAIIDGSCSHDDRDKFVQITHIASS